MSFKALKKRGPELHDSMLPLQVLQHTHGTFQHDRQSQCPNPKMSSLGIDFITEYSVFIKFSRSRQLAARPHTTEQALEQWKRLGLCAELAHFRTPNGEVESLREAKSHRRGGVEENHQRSSYLHTNRVLKLQAVGHRITNQSFTSQITKHGRELPTWRF